MATVLITGVGGPTPIGIAKSLKLNLDNLRLIGTDASRFAPGLYRNELFNKTYHVPVVTDENYWPVMEKIVKKEQIDFAFVVPETEVIVWSKYQERGEIPCKALLPDVKIASFVYDKFNVSKKLEPLNLSPKTIKVKDYKDLGEIGNNLGYPYWVRERSGAGALHSFKIKSHQDLKIRLNVNQKSNSLIASTYLPGRNYACKVLFKSGDLVMAATAERIEYLLSNAAPSGISGICARGGLINHHELIPRSIKTLEHLHRYFGKKVHGMFTIDFKEDKEGIALITEINIRHVSFTHAFSLGGANFSQKTFNVFYKDEPYETQYYSFDDKYNFIRGVDNELFIISGSDIKK